MKDEQIYSQFESFWKEITFEDWMDEDDYQEVKDETFKQLGISREKIVEDIKTGINNGYSIDFQFDLLKKKLQQA